MQKNVGSADKTIRLIVAAIIAVAYFMGMISGTTAIVLGALAIVFALTSLINFCPLYSIFGINTSHKKSVN